MLLTRKIRKKKTDVMLNGAVQVNRSTFFVYADSNGRKFLTAGEDEKYQKYVVNDMIKKNPRVLNILKKYNIKPSIDTKTLKSLAFGHMNDTCKVALGIYSILKDKLNSNIDESTIKEASMLHDFGKVLIPSKILNKPARLNRKEREIMNVHSTLGYELLKTQNINKNILSLIKYHHQNLNKSGYPYVGEITETEDIGVQIISTADKYSALREARVYRKALSKTQSLLILYREVREGKISQVVFDALLEYAETYDI